MFHLEALTVRPEFRGKGIGLALHKRLKVLFRKNWPWVRYASGEVTSVGALRLLIKVYGTPLYIADQISQFTLEEAVSRLPLVGTTDERGNIDTSYGALWANVWLGPGRPPKDHPWADK